jgi:hypothetical protein
MKSVSARAGFVAEVETTPMLAKPNHHFAQTSGRVSKTPTSHSSLPWPLSAISTQIVGLRIQSDVVISFITPALHA